MKKSIFSLLIGILSLTVITACSDDDDGGGNNSTISER